MKPTDSNTNQTNTTEGSDSISPASFVPPEQRTKQRKNLLRPLPMLLGAVLLLLFGSLFYVFTAKPVTLNIQPTPDSVEVSGGFSFMLGGNRLMRKGDYSLIAKKAGYHDLEEDFTVGKASNPQFDFEMRKLPGRINFTTSPSIANVTIDKGSSTEKTVNTPVEGVLLEPGEHSLFFSAPRYQDQEASLVVEGMSIEQNVSASLVPNWADISLSTKPADVSILVDNVEIGKTALPNQDQIQEDATIAADVATATVEILAGSHRLRLQREGYEPWERDIEVIASEPQTIDLVELEKEYGKIEISSEPADASVTVNNEYKGRTPLSLSLKPDIAVQLKISKAGYQTENSQQTLESGEQKTLELTLKPILGTIKVRATPRDAEVYVDGVSQGQANKDLRLTATPHNIEIRKAGYVTYKKTITPKPGFAQTISAKLLTPRQAKLAAIPKRYSTKGGQEMVLVSGGRFTMGSPRREQGRRANEGQRDIQLKRNFFIATKETSNEQFRQFRKSHSSGIVARKTLDNDNHAVSRVSWKDAVAYCNWLSEKEGLPAAYKDNKLIVPVNTGYRLPTEAEWVWVARFAKEQNLKYPWGNTMPPTGNAGNYADTSAAAIMNEFLTSYRDGYAAVAPTGRFNPNRLGIYDLGGNVSEWTTDYYKGFAGSLELEVDPIGEGKGETHTIRGSSWRHGRITELRLAYRDSGAGGKDDVGFRVARYAE